MLELSRLFVEPIFNSFDATYIRCLPLALLVKITKKLNTLYTNKGSFLIVPSITDDPNPFLNFKPKFNLGFNIVLSNIIQEPINFLIVTQSREYITVVTNGGIDRWK